jgi:hypothetical protein
VPGVAELDERGYVLLRAELDRGRVAVVTREVACALSSVRDDRVRRKAGQIVGARSLESICPRVTSLLVSGATTDLLAAALGDRFGLVRAMYFDKPPGAGWSLPWHRDKQIAVAGPSASRLGGVPHVEAPRSVLERMIVVRVSLDDAAEENGALEVAPGSHRTDAVEPVERDVPNMSIGDVLAMRPLLLHRSGPSRSTRPRRVLHFEIAASAEDAPWHRFVSRRAWNAA